MRIPAGVIAIAVLGCGGGGGSTDARSDGPPPADGMPDGTPDGTPDAHPVDARPPTPGGFVIDMIDVPETSGQTLTLGLDIDGDEPGGDTAVDNQLGAVLAALTAQGFDVQTSVNIGVDTGTMLNLAFFDDVTFRTYAGANPQPPACTGPGDTVCRHHLDGSGQFDLATAAPTGTMPATTIGAITNGGPGTATLSLTMFGSPTAATLDLIGARFRGTIEATGITAARLGGAITQATIDNQLLPVMAEGIQAIVALECAGSPPPACGCAPGSQAATLINLFDDDQTCTITTTDLQNSTLIQGFTMPDVNIDGVDAVSFGVGITAVPAAFTFTPP